MRTSNVIIVLFWSVCFSYNSALEPNGPLTQALRGRQGMSVIVCLCICTHVCEEESPRNGMRQTGIIHETLQGKGWGCIGRGLFDKQTCYPIR